MDYEVEVFDFEKGAHENQDRMNSRIKEREAEGWSVSQIEHLRGYDEHEDVKQTYTLGMMVVFIQQMQATRCW